MTTTVVTGTLGFGLGAAALAGAVGLGLAAAAFGAKLGRGGGGGGYRGHGGYGHGGHGGGGYGYGHGRRRRSDEEDESEALERVLEVIRHEDVTGCGLRLVCELASEDEDVLTEEELSILNLVGSAVNPGEGLSVSKGLQDYRIAKGLGLNKVKCGQAFPMCPLNGTQLMESVMAYLP